MNRVGDYPRDLDPTDQYGSPLKFRCKECERRSQSRYQCCWCGLSFVATILNIVTVAYLILEAVSMVDANNKFVPWSRAYDKDTGTDDTVAGEEQYLFYDCDDIVGGRYACYNLIRGLLALCLSAYFVATIGFMAATVIGDAEAESQLSWAKIFMWVSFIYPVLSRILLLVDILVIHADCSKSTLSRDRFNSSSFCIAVLSMVNGFVAIVAMILVQGQNMKDEEGKIQGKGLFPVDSEMFEAPYYYY